MKILKYIYFALMALIFASCEEGAVPETPSPCLTTEIKQEVGDEIDYVEAVEVKLGESIYFSSCGSSDYAVIYPGDENHVFPTSENDIVNSGFPLTYNDRFSYTYTEPGEYTATLLESNVSIYNSSKDREIKRASVSVTIIVTE